MTQTKNFDELITVLGGFGTYQRRLYFLIVAPAFFVSIMSIITIFTIHEQNHRCRIPGLQNDSYGSEIYKLYTNQTELSVNQCHVVNNTANLTEACHDWVYDTSHRRTLVSEFDLVCQQTILQTHATMGLFAGALVGALVFGSIGDRFGRKMAICLALLLMIIGNIGAGLVQNYYSFVLMRVIGGMGNLGYWNSAMILGFEIAGPRNRLWTGMLIEVVWVIAEYTCVFVAYFVQDWRTLHLIFAVPLVIFLSYWKLLTESPRWLINQGKHKAAYRICKTISNVNGADVKDLDLIEIKADNDTESTLNTLKKIATSRVILIRCLILSINWIAVNIGYFGLTFNVGKIGGSVYVNFTISVTMELIAYVICMLFMDRIGRRALHCSSMLVGGVSLLITIFPVIYGSSFLRTRQKLRSLNELRPGDGIGIVRARGLYKHHAIVSQIIGTDRFTVIELTGDSADSLMFSSSVGPKANVSETALNFSKCHRVYKYRYNSRRNDGYHPIDIARTLFLEGLPQDYQFLKFNCEHFVSYCITGFPYSKQTGKFNSDAKTLLDDYVRDRIKRLPNPLVKLPTENAYFMTDGSSQFYVQPKEIDIYSDHKYSTLDTGSMPGSMWFDDHYDEYYSGNDVVEDSYGYLSQTPGDRTSYYELSRSQPVLY